MSNNTSFFKEIVPATDVRAVQKMQSTELFGTKKALVKPFSSSANIEITTSSAFPENSGYYNPISFVDILGSGETYFTYIRADSSSYANASGSGMSYRQITSMTSTSYNEKFKINDGIYVDTSDKLDIIAISREYYRDSLDPLNFGILINTGSSTPTTNHTTFDIANGIRGLYPSTNIFNSPMGAKRYLYLVSSSYSSAFYNTNTDEFSLPAESFLEKTDKPYGEVHIDTGVVVLYVDKLKAKFSNINTASALHYVAGIGGASHTQLNGTIYFTRMYNTEFNFSKNPTFFENNQGEIIKEQFRINPVVYVTGVGLYNEKNELIAFGRPSTPLKKTFDTEYIFKLELNY